MKVLKKNYKLLIGFIIGLAVAGTTVYAAAIISSEKIDYDNTSSGLSSTNVKSALDELSVKAKNTNSKNNIVIAYTYNESSCVTGDEATCEVTKCYETKTANSCPTGTIIKYRVNAKEIKVFNVMYDNGTTMTMQQRENTVNNYKWHDSGLNNNGPETVLTALELATSTWTNVNTINYTMGTTIFKTNAYTGCSEYNSCTTNKYTLSNRSAKARMITVQEAVSLGCNNVVSKTCPKWMYNYLYYVYSEGEIYDYHAYPNWGYWTMNAVSTTDDRVWTMYLNGSLNSTLHSAYLEAFGARAVVVINK